MTLYSRRQALGFSASASAGMLRPAGQSTKWHDDRLGVVCRIEPEEGSAREVFQAARTAGYTHIQLLFPWTRATSQFLDQVPSWLGQEDLRTDVVSAYVNSCSPEKLLTDCRAEDFVRAIDLAGRLGCRRLVAWTGGFGSGLMKADPRNFEPAAADAIHRFVEGHSKRLEDAGLKLALETYITLACPESFTLRALLDRLPPHIGAVMDPPNLTPAARYGQRDEELQLMFRLLASRIHVVHLKDFTPGRDKDSYRLPGPMQGEMNYPLFARKILALPGNVPIVAEHIQPAEFQITRERLLPVFRAAAQTRSVKQ